MFWGGSRILLVAALLVVGSASARGESPAGQVFTIEFGNEYAIWNFEDFLSGCDSICETVGQDVICLDSCFDAAVPVDAYGRIQSSGTFDVAWSENGTNIVDASFETMVTGSVTGNSYTGTTTVYVSLNLNGSLDAKDGALTVSSAATGYGTFTGQVDPNGQLSGTLSMSLCLPAKGCAYQSATPVASTLSDGSWSVSFAPADNGLGYGGLVGSGLVRTADGSFYFYDMTGLYSSYTDASSVSFTYPKGAAAGSYFSISGLVTNGANIEAGSASYGIQGRSGSLVPLAP